MPVPESIKNGLWRIELVPLSCLLPSIHRPGLMYSARSCLKGQTPAFWLRPLYPEMVFPLITSVLVAGGVVTPWFYRRCLPVSFFWTGCLCVRTFAALWSWSVPLRCGKSPPLAASLRVHLFLGSTASAAISCGYPFLMPAPASSLPLPMLGPTSCHCRQPGPGSAPPSCYGPVERERWPACSVLAILAPPYQFVSILSFPSPIFKVSNLVYLTSLLVNGPSR